MFEVVWLSEERTFAFLIRRDAYTSVVEYTRDGVDYEIIVDNDEYEFEREEEE